MNTDNPYDIEKIAKATGLPVDDLKELLQEFIGSMENYTDKLNTAISENDHTALESYAHKFKGAAMNFRFMELAELLKTMGKKAKGELESDYALLLETIMNEVGSIKKIKF